MTQAPTDDTITFEQLTKSPYPIYERLRAETPVLKVKAVGRTLLTKAADTRAVKDNPVLFSSNDPDTPMERTFHAHTLMRKDGKEHLRERMAMMPAFSPKNIKTLWTPAYEKLANEYLDRLPRNEIIDLFPVLAGPVAARILSVLLGIEQATDNEMQQWSQALIDGAGNFNWADEPFERVDTMHVKMDAIIEAQARKLKNSPDQTALSVMVNADNPIPMSQKIGRAHV